MLSNFDAVYFAVALPCILLALSLHEFAHAAMADKLGDPTPRMQGRLTLNPLAHLDPLGTIFILMTMLVGFGFGWGKPVLTNPMYYRNYRQGLLFVAAAGPLMNICLAMIGLGFAFLIFKSGQQPVEWAMLLMRTWIIINIVLATFNLIPIPPLDGGNILASLLPGRAGEQYRMFGQYGMFILLGMMYFGMISMIIGFFFYIDFLLISLTLGADFANWLLGSVG